MGVALTHHLADLLEHCLHQAVFMHRAIDLRSG